MRKTAEGSRAGAPVAQPMAPSARASTASAADAPDCERGSLPRACDPHRSQEVPQPGPRQTRGDLGFAAERWSCRSPTSSRPGGASPVASSTASSLRGSVPVGALAPFLRALGAIFFSAFFYSLAYQIHGLIGPRGITPRARDLYLEGSRRRWAPSSASGSLRPFSGSGRETARSYHARDVVGLAASVLLVFNVWPRVTIVVAGLAFLSFIAVAEEFAMYQSDGMLLEAAFLSFFFAPRGWRPGLRRGDPAVGRRALPPAVEEWFQDLLFAVPAGVVKLASQPTSDVVEPHGDGPLLRERPPADVDRLVRAAPAAPLPRLHRHPHLRRGARARVVSVARASRALRLLRDRDPVPGRDHSHRQLRLPELPRPRPGRPSPRRRPARADRSANARLPRFLLGRGAGG